MGKSVTVALERNKVLFNRWAPQYDFPLFQFFMKKFHRPVLEEITFLRNPAILDISCGTGELLRLLHIHGKGKGTLWGIDIAEKMLVIARRKLPRSVHLKKADVHELPFPDRTFYYVVTTEAFHHYYDQRKALREMKRVVKEQGKVIIVDVNFFFPLLHFLFQKLEPGCVKINNRSEMRALFAEAGLRVVKQQRTFLFAVTTIGVNE